MHLIGIPLRKPTFAEFTASGVMAAGLFVLAIGCAHALAWPLGIADAGALLVVLMWGCVSARVGIHIGRGQRHLMANLLVSAALLGAYQAAWAVVV